MKTKIKNKGGGVSTECLQSQECVYEERKRQKKELEMMIIGGKKMHPIWNAKLNDKIYSIYIYLHHFVAKKNTSKGDFYCMQQYVADIFSSEATL